MRVYLVRHGEAWASGRDPRRPLTPRGRRQIQKTAEILAAAEADTSEIWHSEKLRAKETAEIIAERLGNNAALREDARLRPNGPVEDVALEIEAQRKDILLAGHLPFMSLIATFFLSGVADEHVIFATGSVACFSFACDTWDLEWLMPPDLI